MAIRKWETYKTLTQIEHRGHFIPAGTELLLSKVVGGTNPVVMYLSSGQVEEVALSSRHVKTFQACVEYTWNIQVLMNELFIRDQKLVPLLKRPYREGDIVEVKHQLRLDNKASLTKGQRLRVIHGGAMPTFAYFHPLEYIQETVSWPHETVKLALVPIPDEDVECNAACIANINVAIQRYGPAASPDDAFIAKVELGDISLRVIKREEDKELTVEAGREFNVSRLAAEIRKGWSQNQVALYLQCEKRLIGDETIIKALVTYYLSRAHGLMSLIQFMHQQELIAWRQACRDGRQRANAMLAQDFGLSKSA